MSACQPAKSKGWATKCTEAQSMRTAPSDKRSESASTGSALPEKRRRKESLTRDDISSIFKAVLEALTRPLQCTAPNSPDSTSTHRFADTNNSSRHDNQQLELGT